MATFTVTISNSLNLFGGSPATRWGTSSSITMVWGTTLWGEGSRSLDKSFTKVISASLSLDGDVSKSFTKVITNTLTVSGDMAAESLTDGAGYSYVFPDRVTDAEDRSFAAWSTAAAAAGSWSTATASSTTWSEA